MITGMAHACFTVSNLDASIHFYQDQLGLKPAFDFRRDDGTRFGCYLHLGGRTFIELFQGQLGERAHDLLHIPDPGRAAAAGTRRSIRPFSSVAVAWSTVPVGSSSKLDCRRRTAACVPSPKRFVAVSSAGISAVTGAGPKASSTKVLMEVFVSAS